jgi:putative phosphotransacetylase
MAKADEKVLVEVSARHVHLTQDDVDILFGKGYELTVDKWLSQPGQFLCKEKVMVVGPKKTFERVGIIGPVRSKTQFELSKTDCIGIGVQGFLRLSGDVAGTPGIIIKTEKGQIEPKEGVIIAKRHLHMTPADAEHYGLKDGQNIAIRVDCGSGRSTVFEDTIVRVSSNAALAMHIDTDEGNAALMGFTAEGEIIR